MKTNECSDIQPVLHEIAPVYDENSRILILGSFPSVKSRESGFFYGHPQNRFWKVLAGILDVPVPVTIDEKKKMLLGHHIAVWDVIASCEIKGSSDSSIKHVVPNDLNRILSVSHIEQIYTNGNAAFQLYEKYCKSQTHMDAIKLPSTSPANAVYSLEKLVEIWKSITQYTAHKK